MADIGPLIDELRRTRRPTLVVHPAPGSAPRSVALLSGSFDPITVGHAAMAHAVSATVELVTLVYSVRTLPKEREAAPSLLAEDERIAALRRFCERRGYAVGLCSHGLLAEQVQAASERFTRADLLVTVGSDKLLQLLDPRWYEDRDAVLAPMFERARVLYAMRAGDDQGVSEVVARPENRRWNSRIDRLEVGEDLAAVSSRQVRELLRRGEDVAHLVPEEVRELLPGL